MAAWLNSLNLLAIGSDHPWGKAAAEEDKVHFWYKSRNVEEPTAESEEATKERAQSAIQTHFNVRL